MQLQIFSNNENQEFNMPKIDLFQIDDLPVDPIKTFSSLNMAQKKRVKNEQQKELEAESKKMQDLQHSLDMLEGRDKINNQ